MHGVIFKELERFVDAKLEPKTWHDVLRAANITPHAYLFGHDYPDAELFSLIDAAAAIANVHRTDLGEAFGEFIAPHLVEMYARLIKPQWRTLDTIEHTEIIVHAAVRSSRPDASPPRLKVDRVGPNEIILRYDSPRKMCCLAKGIARGVATHHGERINIEESACMLADAAQCELRIRTV